MKDMLEFRPHHFLCTLGFVGKGYSPEFVKNFQKTADLLRKTSDGDQVLIRVTSTTDDICVPCPHRREKLCASEPKIMRLDHAHAEVLNLKEGDVLTWGEAKNRLAKYMSLEKFEKACAPCAWKALGVCKSALVALQKNAKKTTSTALSSKSAPTLLTLIFIFGWVILPSPSLAKSNDKVPPKITPIITIDTIDTIQTQLFANGRSKAVEKIKNAISALQKKKYEEARKVASSILKDELFPDYGFFLTGESYRQEAEERSLTGKWLESPALALKATSSYLKIAENHPYSHFLRRLNLPLAEADFLIGNAHFAKKLFSSSQVAYERGLQRLLTTPGNGALQKTPLTVLQNYAETCARAPGALCQSWVLKLVSIFPKSSEEIKAIAKHLPDLAEKAHPGPAVRKLTQAYKATDLDATAFESALLLYLDGKYRKAAAALRQFLDEFPKSTLRFRARYLLGNSLEQDGDPARARKIWTDLSQESPLTYYGLLSAFHSGQSVETRLAAVLPSALPRDPALLPWEMLELRRAEALITGGMLDFAAEELSEIRPRDSFSSQFLMYLAALNSNAENYKTCFAILSELIQRGYEGIYSSFSLRLIFPTLYFEQMRTIATRHELDPLLVLSLVKQESAFDKEALSSSGAAGLMQLMPATAIDVEPEIHRSDLVTTENNLRVGIKYLKKLLTRYDGNIALSLAAYNAGPTVVDRWIREGRAKHGLNEFIEMIPYRETREYVASIMRNYYWYARKVKGEVLSNLSLFWASEPTRRQPTTEP